MMGIHYFIPEKMILFETVEQKSYAGRSDRVSIFFEATQPKKRVVLGCERPEISGLLLFYTSFNFFIKYFNLFTKSFFICLIVIDR
jgi:hypothetical protein